jgi:hypothetical protein
MCDPPSKCQIASRRRNRRAAGRTQAKLDALGCDGGRRVRFVVGTDYDEFERTL